MIRDLKPSNILVTEDGDVKLLDFGISKLLGPREDETQLMTRSGAFLMTPECEPGTDQGTADHDCGGHLLARRRAL